MPGRLIGSPVVGTGCTGVGTITYATTRALEVDSLRRKREVRFENERCGFFYKDTLSAERVQQWGCGIVVLLPPDP